ncbi:MAG TPA: 2-thiouracil desulfurase family protein [Desulfomonilia bacterium]|nr:2-thiouracil desulfurase family protein [Desulfomonilia bacterium]
MVLVSACILGIRCRYDGSARKLNSIRKISDVIMIPVCPELLGGLPTPRPEAFFTGGDGGAVIKGRAFVRDTLGRDVTQAFLKGAEEIHAIARDLKIGHALLKERSPSCGTHKVWVEGHLQDGIGVTAAVLKVMGVHLMNEDGLIR